MQTSIILPFGDGEYRFCLPIKHIVEIEAKAGLIDAVKHRLIYGGFGINDVVEVIRHGLIAGGEGMVNGATVAVSDMRANMLVEAHVDGKPLGISAEVAKQIIAALYVGYDAGDDKKKESSESLSGSTGGSSSTTAEPSD